MLIVLAVGGTGGHLFPAQALADELLKKDHDLEILFAGAHLNTNRFLDKSRFRYKEVVSATPFRRNPFRAGLLLFKGLQESIKLFRMQRPDLVVGFGSYHSFPLLLAAKLLKVPFILFEADTIPGKVNRLFSRFALFTAIHFSRSAQYLKGKAIPVAMPSRHSHAHEELSQEQAREFLGIAKQCFTLLVFGGSQGAKGINHHILSLVPLLKSSGLPFQLIHITGNEETSAQIKALCGALDIACYVKEFETQMSYLWKAATLMIGRSGASTLAEMIRFKVPGILVPYPHASDGHQHSNAQFLEEEVKGGVCLLEEKLTADGLCSLICACEKKLEYYQASMQNYKESQQNATLGKLIYEYLALH